MEKYCSTTIEIKGSGQWWHVWRRRSDGMMGAYWVLGWVESGFLFFFNLLVWFIFLCFCLSVIFARRSNGTIFILYIYIRRRRRLFSRQSITFYPRRTCSANIFSGLGPLGDVLKFWGRNLEHSKAMDFECNLPYLKPVHCRKILTLALISYLNC